MCFLVEVEKHWFMLLKIALFKAEEDLCSQAGEVASKWRPLHYREHNNLYSTHATVWVGK
jgi:hypothetical protein